MCLKSKIFKAVLFWGLILSALNFSFAKKLPKKEPIWKEQYQSYLNFDPATKKGDIYWINFKLPSELKFKASGSDSPVIDYISKNLSVEYRGAWLFPEKHELKPSSKEYEFSKRTDENGFVFREAILKKGLPPRTKGADRPLAFLTIEGFKMKDKKLTFIIRGRSAKELETAKLILKSIWVEKKKD